MSEIIPKKQEDAALGIYLGFTNSYVGIYADNAVNVLTDVSRNSGNPSKVALTDQGKPQQFPADDIAPVIILKLKQIAEDYLGYSVQNATIAVPAYFSDKQRAAMKQAGTQAGLNILRIINEPTAAAVSYNIHNEENTEKHLLVFHLGGRTVEATVLCVEQDVFELQGRDGKACLGGQDFDGVLVNYCVDVFFKETNINIKENIAAMNALTIACEKAKIELTTCEAAKVQIDNITESRGISLTIQRSTFEELCLPLFQECISSIERAVKEANISPTQIDEIIISGASTRIPKITELITAFFKGKLPFIQSINPEERVAYGAAIQAAIFSDIYPLKHANMADLIIDDVNVLSLGIQTLDKCMKVIIPRGMYIPGRKSITVTTSQDYQTSIGISIFEGERIYTKDNQLLGKFQLDGIVPQLKGIPQILVEFEIDANGILHASAEERERDTVNSKKIQIVNESRLTAQDIQKIVTGAERFEQEDELIRIEHEEICKLINYSFAMRKHMNEDAFKSRLINNEEQMIQETLVKLNAWIEQLQNVASSMTSEAQNKSKELENIFNPIAERINSLDHHGQIVEIVSSSIEPLGEA